MTLKLPETWVHYPVPRFGIQDVLLPEGHGTIELKGDTLSGGYNGTPGRFEIKLLHSEAQVSRELAALQEVISDPDNVIDPLVHTDFGVAVSDGMSLACSVCFDAGGEISQAEYRVILKSPFGHGLYISFLVPTTNLDFAKEFGQKLISSLKWADRSLLVKDAASNFVGSWRCKSIIPENESTKPGARTVATEDFNFDAGGDFSYTKVYTHTDESGEEETEVAGFGFGNFEAYASGDEVVHLLTMDGQTGVDECCPVEMKDDKMIRDGKEWIRVIDETPEFEVSDGEF